jgi:hypothetical protein
MIEDFLCSCLYKVGSEDSRWSAQKTSTLYFLLSPSGERERKLIFIVGGWRPVTGNLYEDDKRIKTAVKCSLVAVGYLLNKK